MVREFNLDVNGCNLCWLDESSGLREIKNDMDALTMANSIGSIREIYVCVRIASAGLAKGIGNDDAEIQRGHATHNKHEVDETEFEEIDETGNDLEGRLLGINSRGKMIMKSVISMILTTTSLVNQKGKICTQLK